MWTSFMDMHSGGGLKEGKFHHIYIEAGEPEAVVIFYNHFGHSPNRVTCTCCGSDYSIQEHEDLEQATGYERGCGYENNKYVETGGNRKFQLRDYRTLKQFLKDETILVVYADCIKPEEREGSVPDQGYVWVD